MSSLSPAVAMTEKPPATDLVPVMGTLLAAIGDSDIALRAELVKTSQVISTFIEQTNEQLRTLSQQNIELEVREISHQAGREEAKKMHEAQMKAIEELTQTVMSLNQRVGTLESRVSSITATEQIMQNKFDAHKHNLILFGCTQPYGEYSNHLVVSQTHYTSPQTYATTPPK